MNAFAWTVTTQLVLGNSESFLLKKERTFPEKIIYLDEYIQIIQISHDFQFFHR